MPTRTLLPTFNRLAWVDRELDGFLANAWTNGGTRRAVPNRTWAPAIDVAELPEAFLIAAELPGVDPKSIEVSFDRGTLSIRGAKQTVFQAPPKTDEKNGSAGLNLLMSERTLGNFERTIQLPTDVDGDAIAASSEHGVLVIRVPKADRARPRKIEVKPIEG
jgi:HSP20 family protein